MVMLKSLRSNPSQEVSSNPSQEVVFEKDKESQIQIVLPERSKVTDTPDEEQVQDDECQLAKPRGRGRLVEHKKGDPPMKKARTSDSCIKNQCNIDVAMNFFHLKVLKKLNEDHIRTLAATPFLHLFAFPVKTQVSNPILHEILLMWDNKGYFVFRDQMLRFTADEVALIMCLGKNGSNVQYKRESVTASRLRSKYFGSTGKITRVHLESAILKAIEDNEDKDDIVGLLIMYLFTMILFPQTCGRVPVHMFTYADRLADLKDYNWSEAVYKMLMDNIPNNAT